MRRILGLEALEKEPLPVAGAAVTIGKFFALHRGHQALLHATREAARTRGLTSVAVTFDRHPAEVLRPGTSFPLLATLEQRLQRMEAEGLDVALVLAVEPRLLALEAEDFVRRVLVRGLGARLLLAGPNFRFGRAARGDLSLLERMGKQAGFEVLPFEPVILGGAPISSSLVARCLGTGDVAMAARLLGRPYTLEGTVQPGEALGRKLGFPTANVEIDGRRLLPADGVYTVRVTGEPFPGEGAAGVANLGTRPTVRGRRRLLEVHLLDYEGDLYGARLEVAFLERLRGEQAFPDLEALRAQITQDVQAARLRFLPG